ncbi:hypothetical protein KSC_055870 [Ktedonobacter sp. SOSP1-52]|uniref:hypothetical protein n=1 Tax=Ktedonobacter sp. SOSP1-52 TaxID=2778366 RepID=UPI00191506FF|nr:hypothetical protein [Ktedonobacter sp. SOSP1-52]GHO66695.1 hypothetical protein KSC_055870 [Ktedonobacter sp. SOSP1-52]
MDTKKWFVPFYGLIWVGVSIWLSGCGSVVGQGTPPAWKPGTPTANPTRVQITLDLVGPSAQTKPVVTLTNAHMVRQLYSTIYALEQMPDNIACTAERGPHYMLTFLEGERVAVSVLAQRDGCRPVSIKGEAGDRRASNEFWTLLDKAIDVATPAAKPQSVAILHTLQPEMQVESTQVMDTVIAQRLYNSILKLQLLAPFPQSTDPGCQEETYPEYRLVFHTAEQVISSLINKSCGTISLDGNHLSRTGTYKRDAQFDQLFAEMLRQATFSQARPDQLMLQINSNTGDQQKRVKDVTRLLKLYDKALTLPTTQPEPNCPSSEDKIAGKARYTSLSFTQWDLPVLSVSVYEGSCKRIDLGMTSKVLRGDQEFWDLLHHLAQA